MSMQAVRNELREIKDLLKPEPTYIERFKLSKAAVVSTFAASTLKVDGQAFNLYAISTDGDLADVSYQVENVGGEKVDEMEAEQFAYIPGPVRSITFKNDTAESGKSIFVTAFRISRLAPPFPQASPPGAGSKTAQVVDPEVLLAGFAKLPYKIALATNPVFKVLNVALSGTNTYMTFESPVTTDYSVPTGKKFEAYRLGFYGAAADISFTLASGSNGVANGTTEPSDFIRYIGSGTTGSYIINEVANRLYSEPIYISVAADLFPAVQVSATNALKSATLYGVEIDA